MNTLPKFYLFLLGHPVYENYWFINNSTDHKAMLWAARRRQIRGVRCVDFFLFPFLKSIMKGARFAYVAAIKEGVTAVLR
jgi:hypothetical protein